jgi:hypothetical protein
LEKRQTSSSELHFYSLVVNNDEFNSLVTLKPKLFKYPERSSLALELQYSKSYSELQECRLWNKDSVTYAFVLVKDTKKVSNPNPYAGDGDFRDIGDQVTFSCYILKLVNSDFVIFEKWASSIEVCYDDLSSQNIDFHITDINNDGKVEVWYVIEWSCSLGVEPSKLEIYLFNNGMLNTMESVTNFPGQFTDNDIREWIKDGDDFVINRYDSNFEKLSQDFKTYAIELRTRNLYGRSNYWR